MGPPTPAQILREAQTEAFLVSDLTNVRYMTGLDLSAGLILVRPRRVTLFVDGRYREVADRSARRGVTVRDAERIVHAMSDVSTCGVESESLTLERYRLWKRKFSNTKFVQRKGVVERFRRQKSAEELRAFRRSQKITQEMMRRVPTLLRRSITERELAWKLMEWARELGAETMAFESIVAFGTHTSRPHHSPTDRRLKKGHIVQIDTGVKYGGYCSDQSAVFFTKRPSKQQKHIFRVLSEAKDAAIDAVRPGVEASELDAIARDILEREGIEKYFTHSLGHGVGLDIHEGITLSSKRKSVKLLQNEIITIEPGVYFPGRFGMRVEEEVIVQ